MCPMMGIVGRTIGGSPDSNLGESMILNTTIKMVVAAMKIELLGFASPYALRIAMIPAAESLSETVPPIVTDDAET
jgi:hypothetical protein